MRMSQEAEDLSVSQVADKPRTVDPHDRGDFQVNRVRLTAWVALAVNLCLTAFKFLSGVLGHSQAIVADAVHSLSDLTTDVAVLVGVQFWSAPADEWHPYGHRRIETAVTVVIGAVLAGVGAGLGYQSLTTLKESHNASPGGIAFIAALVSIVVKEILYRWTARVGRKIKSAAVVANAWHHRSDALSSIPAAVAVAGASFVPTWAFLDHVGALIVSLFILHAAWVIVKPAAGQLVDVGAPKQDRNEIEAIALETPGVSRIHAVRTRFVGSGLQVDLHILVDGGLSVREGHDIAGAVKRRLKSYGPNVLDVVVHVEPDT